jgi:hypothetical protein
MNLGTLAQRAGKVAAKNSPAILTAIGVTGTLTTAYLAAKAAFKSVDVLKEAEGKKLNNRSMDDIPEGEVNEPSDVLTKQEKFEAVWKLYAPAAASAAMTVSAIILANRIGERRNAALASAYSVVQEGYKEYRAKATEKVGKKKEEEIRAEVAQERMNRHPVNQTTLIVTGRGSTLCYDMWNDRYFNSDIESIRKAVNDFNKDLINSSYMALTEFYHLLGLPSTRNSDMVGWDTDKLLEIDYVGTIHPDGTPAIAIDFKVPPSERFATLY